MHMGTVICIHYKINVKEVLDNFGPAKLLSALKKRNYTMKVTNSLKTLKSRDRNNRVIRRKGRVYVINKKNPRMKCRQG